MLFVVLDQKKQSQMDFQKSYNFSKQINNFYISLKNDSVFEYKETGYNPLQRL